MILSHQEPTFADETLYTSGESVRAIALPNYQEKWRFEDECPSQWDQIPDSPVVDGDSVYVTTTCGLLYKLRAQDGQVLWKYYSSVDKDMRSFVVLDNVGYFTSIHAVVTAVDLTNGHEIGRLEMTPSVVARRAWQYLVVSDDQMVLTYGNNQAFTFQASKMVAR